MEYINTQHGLDYKYCPDNDAYMSYMGDTLMGRFPRKYVVEPNEIWKRKVQQAGLTREDGTIDYNDERVKLLKPTQTVFKIWEHHNANINN